MVRLSACERRISMYRGACCECAGGRARRTGRPSFPRARSKPFASTAKRSIPKIGCFPDRSPVSTTGRARSNASFKTAREPRDWRSQSPRTSSDIRSRPICWNPAPTSGTSRSSSAIRAAEPPRSTPTWHPPTWRASAARSTSSRPPTPRRKHSPRHPRRNPPTHPIRHPDIPALPARPAPGHPRAPRGRPHRLPRHPRRQPPGSPLAGR